MAVEEVFVYYRLPGARAEAALAAFELASAGSGVRLLQRADAATGELTWMEIYASADQLAHEPGIAAALAGFVDGERHRERFSPLLG